MWPPKARGPGQLRVSGPLHPLGPSSGPQPLRGPSRSWAPLRLGEYGRGVGRTPSRGLWGRGAHPTPLSQSCCLGFSGLGELPRKLSGPSRPCPGGLRLPLAATLGPRVEASSSRAGRSDGPSPGDPAPAPHPWVPAIRPLLHQRAAGQALAGGLSYLSQRMQRPLRLQGPE